MRILLSVLVLPSTLLFGQLINTVTTTVSRGAGSQPDQAVFAVIITARADQSLEDIVKAVATIGITPANLADVQTFTPFPAVPATDLPTTLQWIFQLPAPLAKFKEITAALASLQQSIAKNGNGLSLSFSVGSAGVSAEQRQDCDYAGLIADARSKAQSIAGATGFGTGTVVGVTGNINQAAPDCALTVSFGLRGQSAQLGPNTITISASRTVNPLPDQALIGISVNSGLHAGLDEITGALAAAGVSGAQFLGIVDQNSYGRIGSPAANLRPLLWSFALTFPLSKLKDTLAQLEITRQNFARKNTSLEMTFSLAGIQASQPAQPACSQADLVADARAQAQKVSAAAGVTLGPILNMSDRPQADSARFAGVVFALGSIWPYVPANLPQTCSLSVQFQLL